MGARRRQMERARAVELEADIAKSGCADLGGEKWFSDAHGELFQVKQDKCSISFQLKNKHGTMYEKKGVGGWCSPARCWWSRRSRRATCSRTRPSCGRAGRAGCASGEGARRALPGPPARGSPSA